MLCLVNCVVNPLRGITQTLHVSLCQMTEANAGSLLVFDPDKLRRKDNEGRILLADKQAVVGIFTERGVVS